MDALTRAAGQCELCGAAGDLSAVAVSPKDDTVALCPTCQGDADANHWRCLLSSMWSEVPAVQVLAWRKLRAVCEPWATEALDTLYLEPEVQTWAEAEVQAVVHRDSNGAVLEQGDTVTLIKDLPVKGAGFTAKRGTAVRGISLVPDNAGHIEGRVEGQRIVILTEFVKKSK